MIEAMKRRPLSRRKYAALVKFFRDVLRDPKASTKLKMTAAIRLDDLYARHEAAELRRERFEVNTEAVKAQTPAEAPAEESTEARLERLRQQYGIGGSENHER